ncbi:MAG: SIMPL domain-containing protein [Planctomycetaceae bacterium]|nr:SIMPL domain-containing protein [Planctomycetaceae bacterium]
MKTLTGILFIAMCTTAIADQALPRTISITGNGSATSPPDMATINTGVVTQGKNAADAMKANNEIMAKLMAALKAQKIPAKDIQTSDFSVSPQYARDDRGRTQQEIVGYRVSNQVRVVIRNLPELGKVLDTLVSTGSNRVSGISFGITDSDGILNEARNNAIADARSKANLYAQALGIKVGKVVSVSESSVIAPRPQFFARAAMADSAVPIASGEQELTATIDVVFAIAD